MFIEPGHSVIDPASPAHALLSQYYRQHLQDLRSADKPLLDPSDHHLHMLHELSAGAGASLVLAAGAGAGLR
jgi:hypothetical protein